MAGCLESRLLIPWRRCRTIAEAVEDLGGRLVRECAPETPLIIIGDFRSGVRKSDFAVRATFDGWCGGIVPLDDGLRLAESQEFTPAGVLCGALAVAESFQFVRGRNAIAGRRNVGMSLWRPGASSAWLERQDTGPTLEWLPASLWLVGLGHLGQAYLWTLGLLPYADASEVSLVLQDFDSLVPANDSTSPLTRRELLGSKKTRAMARWCEERGFNTRLIERRFNSNLNIDEEEPRVALCGVDNETARAALEDVGFSQIIEAGLGLGTEEYLAFQMHCFPATRSSREKWGLNSRESYVDSVISQPAYRHLATTGLDKCGLTTLAGRSVGASFVGTATSAIVVAELLRMCIGGQRYEVVDGSLRALEHCQAIPSMVLPRPFNPGRAKAVRT